MSLFGMKVIESPFAYMQVPNRQHKKRRWMSDAYHRRIQKKWRKRFGTHQEPCAIFMSPRAVGLPWQDMVALPPGHLAILRGFSPNTGFPK
jgi:hypothetical protein